MSRTPAVTLTLACILAAVSASTPARAQDGEALLAEACGSCHAASEAGLSRIAGQRKSPEGWLMTLVRMRQFHEVALDLETQTALVHHLSTSRGLAPSEAAPFRYAFERDPSWVESFDPAFGEMCARCHTGARALLQRRTPEEWALLVEFHVGQFPTAEYQALGRDREWYAIARDQTAPALAESYPLETPEWQAWAAAEWPSPTGEWVVLTELPGEGPAYGRLSVSGSEMPFELEGDLRLADGRTLAVDGRVNLYTGYEWRANLAVGGQAMRQVLVLSEDGTRLEGRQFDRVQDSLGGRLVGARADAGPTILGSVPEAVPGLAAEVQLVGVGLDAVTVEGGALSGLTADPFGAAATLEAEAHGLVQLRLGETAASIAFYDSADRLSIEPAFSIARIGGGGPDSPPPVPAAFRAVAWWNGPDGAPSTDDDIRIGSVPATWSTGNLSEMAELMQDAAFAGAIDADGIFTPGPAGPNPERVFSANNTGELKVEAEALGLTAEAALIVTVQRFIDPPLR